MPRICIVAGLLVLASALRAQAPAGAGDAGVPILVYHHFGPTVTDWMTVRTPVLQRQFEYFQQHGYTVVPLQRSWRISAARARLRRAGPW